MELVELLERSVVSQVEGIKLPVDQRMSGGRDTEAALALRLFRTRPLPFLQMHHKPSTSKWASARLWLTHLESQHYKTSECLFPAGAPAAIRRGKSPGPTNLVGCTEVP